MHRVTDVTDGEGMLRHEISHGEMDGEIRLGPAGPGSRSDELLLEADEADAAPGEHTMGAGVYP